MRARDQMSRIEEMVWKPVACSIQHIPCEEREWDHMRSVDRQVWPCLVFMNEEVIFEEVGE